MTRTVHKVFAYITHRDRLLIFQHTDFPEAGIQVPAGTVKADEELEVAVLREAFEETGLNRLTLHTYLGEQIRNMQDVGRDEIHHQHFYHLLCGETPPEKMAARRKRSQRRRCISDPFRFLLGKASPPRARADLRPWDYASSSGKTNAVICSLQ